MTYVIVIAALVVIGLLLARSWRQSRDLWDVDL